MYEIFEELLRTKGLKPIDVSRATGISSSTLTDWKMGRSIPKRDKMQKIASFLGVTEAYLNTGIENQEIDELNTPKARKYAAKRLDKALNMAGISADALARASEVSKSSISQYLSSDHIPSEENATRMGNVLNVNPLWLMGFDAPMNTKSTADQDERLASIIDYYQLLNDTGRSKAVERMEELTMISNYSIYDSSVSSNEAFLSSNSIQSSKDNKETQTTKGNDSQYLTPAEIDQILSKMTEEELKELINET